MSFPKTASLAVAIIAVTVVGVIGSAPAAQDRDPSTEFFIPLEVKDLLVQRRDTLRQIENELETFYKQGLGDVQQVLNATLERLAADLELAESREARLGILQKQVDWARRQEKSAERRHAEQLLPLADLLRVRANRLALEIDLAREKIKVKRRDS